MKLFKKKSKENNKYQEFFNLYLLTENKLNETRELFFLIKKTKEELDLDEITNSLNDIEENLNQKAYKLLSKGKPEEQLENLDKQYLLADCKLRDNVSIRKKLLFKKQSKDYNFYSYIDGELYENLEPIFEDYENLSLSNQVSKVKNKQKKNNDQSSNAIEENIKKNAFGYTQSEVNNKNYKARFYVEIPQEIIINRKKSLEALKILLEDDKYLNDMIEALKDMSNKLKLLFEDLEMLNKTDELEELDNNSKILQELALSTVTKD